MNVGINHARGMEEDVELFYDGIVPGALERNSFTSFTGDYLKIFLSRIRIERRNRLKQKSPSPCTNERD
jgi:hypothetical protein